MGPQFGGPIDGHAGWGAAGWFVPLLITAVLVGVAVWAVLRVTRTVAAGSIVGAAQPVPTARADAAFEAARMRYARGELGRDEYRQVARDLGAPEVPPPDTGRAVSDP
jgi:uncharacterized membrane protein